MHLRTIGSADFGPLVLEADRPVVVFIRSSDSAPCRMMEGAIERLARTRADLRVCVLDADETPALADTYAVHALPTVLLFWQGTQTARLVGFHTEDQIAAAIDAHLSGAGASPIHST